MMRRARSVASLGFDNGHLQDGELVAAHARDRVGLADQLAQALGRQLEQLVAGGMTQRIVDVLEVVEVEQVHGQQLAAPRAREGLLEALVEQHAVGQAGKRVVQRHVHDLGLRAALLGDVLMRDDDAAIGHALAANGNRSGRLSARARNPSWRCARGALAAAPPGPRRRSCRGSARWRHGIPKICRSGVPGFTWSAVSPYISRIAIVGDDDALLRIEHGKALRHVVQRGIELSVALAQQLFSAPAEH